MITLYIKTHNVTGLKYFGKTVVKNVDGYRGSGTYWLRHIKQHGYDVTTEVVGCYENIEECRAAAIQFSLDNNIVESDSWANLEIETVDGFGNFKNEHTRHKAAKTREKLQTGVQYDEKLRELGSKAAVAKQAGAMNPEHRKRGLQACLEQPARQKRLDTFAAKCHGQGANNSQFGTMWITDGTSNAKIKKTEPIPVGWKAGRCRCLDKED